MRKKRHYHGQTAGADCDEIYRYALLSFQKLSFDFQEFQFFTI